MSLSELKKSGRIREIPVDRKQIENHIALAKRDLSVAETLLKKNSDWSFIASYNSMLQAARALMFSYGYTTSEEERHKTTVEFAKAVLGQSEAGTTSLFDRMRRKRHDVTYDEAGMISSFEAKQALETARRYARVMEKRIRERLGSR